MTVPTPALIIEIDRQQQLPIYLQICERFRIAIAAGHLRPGDRVYRLDAQMHCDTNHGFSASKDLIFASVCS
jgi:hypothetical protein